MPVTKKQSTKTKAKKKFKKLTKEDHAEAKKNAKAMLKLFGEDGKHWITDAIAENKHGESVEPDQKDAVKWCMLGAIDKLDITTNWLTISLTNTFGSSSIPDFNDRDGFDPIKDLLTKIKKHGILSEEIELMEI